MGSINLYKIDYEKSQLLFQTLSQKFELLKTKDITKEYSNGEKVNFGVTLYVSQSQSSKEISWNWLLKEFDSSLLSTITNPKAVLVIEKDDDIIYAVTFGHSYFIIDKYCDSNFAFNYARRLTFKSIKTTTLTTPSSHRNKIVNTYIDFNEIEFNSGESFAKIKADEDLPEDFKLYKPTLEIGNSIKFNLVEDSIENVLNLIIHIENTFKTVSEKHKIPVFSKITDNDYINYLNQKLSNDIRLNPAQVNISELDIIGATEIFNHNDYEYKLKYKKKEKTVTNLTNDEIKDFCKEAGLIYEDVILDIIVYSICDGQIIRCDKVKNLIDYTYDDECCLLSKGVWYKYNDDYLSYLNDSISQIDVFYNPKFNFTEQEYRSYLEMKYNEEKDTKEFKNLTKDKILESLQKKHYAERVYNSLRVQDGFECYDRIIASINNQKVELMDLYKDKTMFSVKIGNSSGKLSQAVNQSLMSLKIYKYKLVSPLPEIKNVALWLILDRKKGINDTDGEKPNINSLGMLMLKNRIDEWKKEVRLLGYTPIIYINYRIH